MIQSMFGCASSVALTHAAVAALVGLRARRPDRRARGSRLSSLNWMPVASIARAHQPAERVDLADQVALRRAADRRIARHVRDRVVRQRADRDGAAEARRGPRRLDPGVARADRR